MNNHLVSFDYGGFLSMNQTIPLGCAHCKKYQRDSPKKLLRLRCSRCKEVHYCSAEHQRAHYPEHKDDCKKNSLLQYKEIHDLNLTKKERPNEPKEMELLTLCRWSPDESPGRAIISVDAQGNRHGYWEDGDGFTALDVTDEVVYKYESFCFTKSRGCRCYLMGQNSLHDAALVIRASDKTKGVTVGDFWSQAKGKWGERFWECDHVFLERVKLTKPGVYAGEFGS